jgi:hypothetical protein
VFAATEMFTVPVPEHPLMVTVLVEPVPLMPVTLQPAVAVPPRLTFPVKLIVAVSTPDPYVTSKFTGPDFTMELLGEPIDKLAKTPDEIFIQLVPLQYSIFFEVELYFKEPSIVPLQVALELATLMRSAFTAPVAFMSPAEEILPVLAKSAPVIFPLAEIFPVTARPFKNVFKPLKLCATALTIPATPLPATGNVPVGTVPVIFEPETVSILTSVTEPSGRCDVVNVGTSLETKAPHENDAPADFTTPRQGDNTCAVDVLVIPVTTKPLATKGFTICSLDKVPVKFV